jgi:hypothetical protein
MPTTRTYYDDPGSTLGVSDDDDIDQLRPVTLRMYDDDDDTNPLRCRPAMARTTEDMIGMMTMRAH